MARVPDCGFRGIPDSRCRRRAHERFPKSGARAQMASADIVGFHRVPQTELLPKAEANDPRRKFRRTSMATPRRLRRVLRDGPPGAAAGRPPGYSCSGTPSLIVPRWMAPRCGKIRRLPVRLVALAVSILAAFGLVGVVAAILTECGPGSLWACPSQAAPRVRGYLRVANRPAHNRCTSAWYRRHRSLVGGGHAASR